MREAVTRKRSDRKITQLHLALDQDEWLAVGGVVDCIITTGVHTLENGAIEHSHHVVVVLDHVRFDDGQSALDSAVGNKGKLKVRMIGHRKALYAEIAPYDANAEGGKRYSISAKLDKAGWGAKP